jgi:hypothetical protein
MSHLKAITLLKIRVKNLESQKQEFERAENSSYALYLDLEIKELNETIDALQKL